MKCYRNKITDEVVYKDEAIQYWLKKYGLTIKPKGQDGNLTNEQEEFLKEEIEWFFSGEWFEEQVYDDNIEDEYIDEDDIFGLLREELK